MCMLRWLLPNIYSTSCHQQIGMGRNQLCVLVHRIQNSGYRGRFPTRVIQVPCAQSFTFRVGPFPSRLQVIDNSPITCLVDKSGFRKPLPIDQSFDHPIPAQENHVTRLLPNASSTEPPTEKILACHDDPRPALGCYFSPRENLQTGRRELDTRGPEAIIRPASGLGCNVGSKQSS